VIIKEGGGQHKALRMRLEKATEANGEWKVVREGKQRDVKSEAASTSNLANGGKLQCQPVEYKYIGPIPSDTELVSKPSQKLKSQIHDVCYKSRLHARRKTPFVPDGKFYYAENCEGLWVCVSKACGKSTLTKTCKFVRARIEQAQRRLWGEFRSPKWSKDPGPMRIIVLDNRTNEQAGCIPELKDGSRGRNGTACPFVFTSREDFEHGVGGRVGSLTNHEMTHGSDMVIRQLVDPYFDNQVTTLWAAYCEKFRFRDNSTRVTALFDDGSQVDLGWKERYCYAAHNRDEFLAECHNVAQGLMIGVREYELCNLSTPEQLILEMPDVWNLLHSHFNLPKA